MSIFHRPISLHSIHFMKSFVCGSRINEGIGAAGCSAPVLWPCRSCPPPRWVCWVRWSWCRVWRWPWPMWRDLGNTGKEQMKRETQWEGHTAKSRRGGKNWKERLRVTPHTTIITGMRTTDKNGGMEEKRQAIHCREKMIENLLWHLENSDLAKGRQTCVKYY